MSRIKLWQVKENILGIRSTGETNMFDVPKVREIALREGYFDLLEFIDDNTSAYVHFILTGEEK